MSTSAEKVSAPKKLKSKSVYIVTQGRYADYEICCVFSTQKLAQEFVNARIPDPDEWPGEMQIWEWPVDVPDGKYRVVLS